MIIRMTMTLTQDGIRAWDWWGAGRGRLGTRRCPANGKTSPEFPITRWGAGERWTPPMGSSACVDDLAGDVVPVRPGPGISLVDRGVTDHDEGVGVTETETRSGLEEV